jgi:tungstate transport system substrate-binding protein
LLDEILPDFEARYNARVDIVAVGTGQAISLGERGDADVLLVHDQVKEQAFVDAGFGSERIPVMYNDFIIVGTNEDPAGIAGLQDATKAFKQIALNMSAFVSRGDQSGTHSREMKIWDMAGINPDPSASWYYAIGQGMGETLQFAQESKAYTLVDRGTYLSLKENLGDLMVVVGGSSIENNSDPNLINEYSVIPVIPTGSATEPSALAEAFAEWLVSKETQEQIAGYLKHNTPVFIPLVDHQP